MRFIAWLLISFLISPSLFSQDSEQTPGPQTMPAPPVNYLDRKACPFEGCAYRQWTALGSVTVYDSWKETRQPVAKLTKGDKVHAITGIVITHKPGVIRLDRDLPEYELKQGDTILTYTYRGEGTSAVWFKGKFYSDFDISFAKWPDGNGCGGSHCAATYIDLGDKKWWAEVKLQSGSRGWVDMTSAKFDGIDMLSSE
jgi:hypothetical protein